MTEQCWSNMVSSPFNRSVYFDMFQLVGAAILEPSTTYLPRWIALLAARGATIDTFAFILVTPLAATSCSPNPTQEKDKDDTIIEKRQIKRDDRKRSYPCKISQSSKKSTSFWIAKGPKRTQRDPGPNRANQAFMRWSYYNLKLSMKNECEQWPDFWQLYPAEINI